MENEYIIFGLIGLCTLQFLIIYALSQYKKPDLSQLDLLTKTQFTIQTDMEAMVKNEEAETPRYYYARQLLFSLDNYRKNGIVKTPKP